MESKKHISYFKVENFKRFRELEISNIGQFNLIVGDNNIGKTSALEAMLADSPSLAKYLSDTSMLFSWRKIDDIEDHDFNYFDLLFHDKTKNYLKFKFKYGSELLTEEFSYLIDNANSLDEKEIDLLNKKTLGAPKSKFVIKKYDRFSLRDILYLQGYENLVEKSYMPLIPFDLSTHDLVDYYSSKFQNSRTKRKELIEGLKFFIHDIEDLEVSTGIIPEMNTLSVWKKNFESPLMINWFGGGTIKTLRVLLEIGECQNSYLMVDEIDSGIHYSRMTKFWESILQSCKKNGVQIFATTHSKECLIYFKEALLNLNLQNSAKVIRLSETSDKRVKAYSYNFEQFEQSLDNNNEIR